MHLKWIDYAIIGLYCAFVLGVGVTLKKHMRTSMDFFLSGRRIPAWITGLAFISANLGALEVMGMAASGAKYGMLTTHFYWLGAIPAMIFVGLCMMPFYYGSRARSVPEYLRLRFDEKTRAFNAFTFAIMTILASGINLYAMALVFKLMLGWSIHATILLSAIVVLVYTFLGGLTSSIYNEVLQFFLIVFGILPLAVVSVTYAGGWRGLEARMPPGFTHMWSNLGNAAANPMGVDWFQMVAGLGFVLSFGYWCTDFLVVQRALAARDMTAAQKTPLIAAIPKMFIPFLVIIPGMAAWVLLPKAAFLVEGKIDYNMALPLLLAHYYPPGMLGVGITALLASFMSGMAGNVTAFNTVWTYDIYQSYIRPAASDEHYLNMGRIATVSGVLLSVLAAYVALSFHNIMDYLQLLFSFVNAPLFATFLLGMFWKRATSNGAFFGLASGTAAAAFHYFATLHGWFIYRSEMAANFDRAIYAWGVCFLVTIIVSFFTQPRAETELGGLVYSLTKRQNYSHLSVLRRPLTLGIVVAVIAIALNWIFR
ncbi:MAG TPA: sodium:solute symporter family protein [Candidatus Acidoferrales bacterium]|nr:sodium:solute symporter family protein [Candidatus Acidoferrales bacterium]